MPNRKNRAKKSIKSIKEAIEEHEKKRQIALEEDNEELTKYYDKELQGMKDQIIRKEKILEKK